MKISKVHIFVVFILAYFYGPAQSFHGFGSSRYAGIHNVVYNPALISAQPNLMESNVFSVYSVVGSDYSIVDIGDGIGFRNGFLYGKDNFSPKDNNNFYKNVDVVGPAFMLKLNENNSIAIVTRIRGLYNVNNISGILLQSADTGFEEVDGFSTSSKDVSGIIHAWTEIGIAYGFQINSMNYTLSFGATLKYLLGAGNINISSPSIEADYDEEGNVVTTQGELTFGYTESFIDNRVNFKSLTGGFGFDIGMVFESNHMEFLNNRSFLLGISLNDFGSINYNTIVSVYDINKAVFAHIFEEDDIKKILNQAYDRTVESADQRIKLPTAIHFFSDVEIASKLFIGIESSISMVSKTEPYSNRIINYYTFNPRYEKKWLSLYSPVTLQQHTGVSWGFGIRIGVVVLASETLLSNAITSTRTNDVFASIKLPLNK